MSAKKNRLELTWVGKYDQVRHEPRVLVEDKSKSYGDPNSENILVYGDNLLALKALEQDFSDSIQCIYIDPPYNTGSAFEHYDDNLEHSQWLNIMKPRLSLLRNLLAFNGIICVHIDDSEGAYLKILMDDIFGRSNHVITFYVQVRYAQKTLKQDMLFHKQIEHVLVYKKSHTPKIIQQSESYKLDKFIWYVEELGKPTIMELGGKKVEIFEKGTYKIKKGAPSEGGLKEIWASGSVLDGNSSGRFFRDFLTGRQEHDGLGTLYKVYGIGDDQNPFRYFTGPKKAGATRGKYYQGVPIERLETTNDRSKQPIPNFYDFAAQFGNCRHEGGVGLKSGKKPEILLKMILSHFSEPGDWILDSFAGSGTTGAVSHKMSRKWIMVELGEQCNTHILPRLKSVIDGKDNTGISQEVKWNGGGGFKYYDLAESLLIQDKELSTKGNPIYIINPRYDDNLLIKSICKIENFRFRNNGRLHGISSENRFLHVTTLLLNQTYLDSLAEDIGPDQSLLIYCTRRSKKLIVPDNIEIKKIPKDLLEKCDFEEDK